MLLFVGDDWAEDHHDVEVMDTSGRRPAKGRLPEGVTGIARLHAMIAEHLNADGEDAVDAAGLVKIGIETDRGPWVQALIAAEYTVFAVNPLQAPDTATGSGCLGPRARTRAVQRLRHALREYFPAALVAFEDLDATDTLELLAKAPDPASAARLSSAQISAALKRARRRDTAARTAAVQAVLRSAVPS